VSGGKCSNCGLVAFAGETACRRCGGGIAVAFAPPAFAALPPRAPASSSNATVKIVFAVLAIVALIGVIVAVGARSGGLFYSPEWRTVTGDGYTVSMPKDPKPSTTSESTAQGMVVIKLLSADFLFSGGFATGSLPLPGTERGLRYETPTVLDAMARGGAERAKITVQRRTEITLDGISGLEVEGELSEPKGWPATMRIYFVPPNRAYMTLVVGPRNGPVYADRERFFDSFRIVGDR